MRNILILGLAVAFTGCITEDEPAGEEGDSGTLDDAGVVGGDHDGGDMGGPGDARPPRPDVNVDPTPDAQLPDAQRPPPDDREALLEAVCERVGACFESDCAPFAGSDVVGDVCDGISDQPDGVLRNLLAMECFDLLALIFQDPDAVEAYCSDEPPTPECEGICGYLPECGVDDAEFCEGFCRTLDEEGRECYLDARERDDCADFFDCFDQQPPAPEEICEPLCEKRWRCLANECAPGTIQEGWFDGCLEACFEAPPAREEAEDTIQGLCEEILPGLFADDPDLGGRCEAAPDEACVQLCQGRLGDCEIDECETRCADWNETNFLCMSFVDECGQYERCMQDGAARDTCEVVCDRYAECLLEACPPRIIRPSLHQECAAGCLFDVPEPEEVEFYLDLECREVREFVYEDNRELAPLCEGDREFRPSPEECVAFCETRLGECIGVGGRQFCLGACATLERDQYQCALEAEQGDCAAIDRCLE